MLNDKFVLMDEELEAIAGGRTYICRKGVNKKGQPVVIAVCNEKTGADGKSRNLKHELSIPVARFEAAVKKYAGIHTFLDANGKPFSL